jgi:DnaJ-class molecular chaperone
MDGQGNWIDYYELLGLYDQGTGIGIGPNVTPQRLKLVWKHERELWHPDNFKVGSRDWEGANERFILIDEAYETLSDQTRKAQYDKQWWNKRRDDGQKYKQWTQGASV